MGSIVVTGKKDIASKLLESGGLLVHLDPRGADVVVPFRFKHLDKLSLPIGLRPDVPAEDLRVDDEGISATLQFRRMAWECRIPWRAVFAVADANGEGSVWLADVPEESRPGEQVPSGPVLIPEPLRTYLVVNGRAIVGQGWSLLATDGEPIPGVRWIDYTLLSIRLGGDVGRIRQHLAAKLPAAGAKGAPPFTMFLGYTAGKQNCRVDWANCRIRAVADDFIEIRAGEGYALWIGSGAGPIPYIREWIARLRRLFRR